MTPRPRRRSFILFSLTSDVYGVFDPLPVLGQPHLADVLALVLVLGQADDKRGALEVGKSHTLYQYIL